MVYLYDGILFSYEEKQSTNISCNMNELGNMMLNERRQIQKATYGIISLL